MLPFVNFTEKEGGNINKNVDKKYIFNIVIAKSTYSQRRYNKVDICLGSSTNNLPIGMERYVIVRCLWDDDFYFRAEWKQCWIACLIKLYLPLYIQSCIDNTL